MLSYGADKGLISLIRRTLELGRVFGLPPHGDQVLLSQSCFIGPSPPGLVYVAWPAFFFFFLMEEWLSLSRILWRPARWSVRGMFVLAALGPACTSVRASADSSMAPLWSDLLLVEPGGQASERHLVFSFTVGNVLRKCFFSTFALIFTLIQFDSKGPQRIACVIDRLCVGTFYKCGPLFWGGAHL